MGGRRKRLRKTSKGQPQRLEADTEVTISALQSQPLFARGHFPEASGHVGHGSKIPANYFVHASCATGRGFLASEMESWPARLVLVATDF